MNPYFSDISKDYVYKAKIDAFDKSFGGLFIVKKLEDNHHRIVFTTEMGNTIFDFSLFKNMLKVNRIPEQMDKKIVVRMLRNDFEALISETPIIKSAFTKDGETIFESELNKGKQYYFTDDQQLQKIERVGHGKVKTVILFSDIKDDKADYIKISHKNFDLMIELKAI